MSTVSENGGKAPLSVQSDFSNAGFWPSFHGNGWASTIHTPCPKQTAGDKEPAKIAPITIWPAACSDGSSGAVLKL